jgi:gluconate kinase
LLDSQLATLEPPGADETALVYDVDADPRVIVDDILNRLEGAHG